MLYFRNMEVETVISKRFYNPPKILFKACMLKTKETKNIIVKEVHYLHKKGKRKVQRVPQSQTAALPRHKEAEETDKSKQAQIEKTYEKH